MTGLPVFDPARRDERLLFYGRRMKTEGWTPADIDTFNALAHRVTTEAPGTLVVPPPGGTGVHDDLEPMLARAFMVVPVDVRLVNGTPRRCHSNTARKWVGQKTKRLSVCTGFCLDADGLWRRHSWLADPVTGRITETTGRRVAYFGYELSTEEAGRWCEANG